MKTMFGSTWLDLLRDNGYARLDNVGWVNEFVDYLGSCPKYPGHVKARPREGVSCNSMQDVMNAPRFLDYARSLTKLVSAYFGEPAYLWSLNAFYTDAATPYIRSINGLHCDTEAPKVCVLFMLGHDTDSDGAQLLMTGMDEFTAVWGAAGTVWLADTKRLPHLGLLPRRPRMLAWARWANIIPEAKFSERLPDVS